MWTGVLAIALSAASGVQAQDSSAHTLSPIRLEIGEWTLVSILNDADIVNGLVAIRNEPAGSGAPDHVWFDLGGEVVIRSHASGVSASEAIRAIKWELGISDEQDYLWPIEVASSENPFDLSGDGRVDGTDLSVLLGSWGTSDPNADIDGDGLVSGSDLAALLGSWGSSVAPEDTSWEPFTADFFDSQCPEENILATIAMTMLSAHTEDEIEPKTVDANSVTENCTFEEYVDLGSEPTISWVNIGDQPRLTVEGGEYFRFDDIPHFSAQGHDAEDGTLGVQMTLDGIPHLPGEPLRNTGINNLVMTVVDSDGNLSSTGHQFFVSNHDYVDFDCTITEFDIEEQTTEGYAVRIRGVFSSESQSVEDINAASLTLRVDYTDPSSGELIQVPVQITGMYSGDPVTRTPESAECALTPDRSELIAYYSVVLPRTDGLAFAFSGVSMGYPQVGSFVFNGMADLAAGGLAGDEGGPGGDDDLSGPPADAEDVDCSPHVYPKRPESLPSALPDSPDRWGFSRATGINGGTSWCDEKQNNLDYYHSAHGINLHAAETKVTNGSFGMMHEVTGNGDEPEGFFGKRFFVTTPCHDQSLYCPRNWFVQVAATGKCQAKAYAHSRYYNSALDPLWPWFDFEGIPFFNFYYAAAGASGIHAAWLFDGNLVGSGQASASAQVSQSASVGINGNLKGVGGGITIPLDPMQINEPGWRSNAGSSLNIPGGVKSYPVTKQWVVMEFNGHSGIETAARGSCWNFGTIKLWTRCNGGGRTKGFTTTYSVDLVKIDDECLQDPGPMAQP